MKVSRDQLERIVALMTIGIAVGLDRKAMTTIEANRILFSPHVMELLRAAGVRESVVALVHSGTEMEDIESLIPHRMSYHLRELIEAALSCLATSGPYNLRMERWVDSLFDGFSEEGHASEGIEHLEHDELEFEASSEMAEAELASEPDE